MTAPPTPSTFELIKDIALPAGGAVVGWFAKQVWMSAKDRKDIQQKNYEYSKQLRDDHDVAYAAYTAALAKYNVSPSAEAANFAEIATTGDRYFFQLNFLCAAILSDMVDTSVRDHVLLAKVRAAADRTLSDHYATLHSIATKHGFKYAGELRREDYSAIFGVVEKYAGQSTL